MQLLQLCQSIFRCFLLKPDSQLQSCLPFWASIQSYPSQFQHHHQVEASVCTQKVHRQLNRLHQHQIYQSANPAHCSCHTPFCTPKSWHTTHDSPKVAVEHSAVIKAKYFWFNGSIKIVAKQIKINCLPLKIKHTNKKGDS